MTTQADTTARLLITCPDRPGIVAAVSAFLFQHGANITELDQHSTDPEGGKFFMRLEFQTPRLDLPKAALHAAFGDAVGKRFDMEWHITTPASCRAWRSWCRSTTTVCSSCCGAGRGRSCRCACRW